MQKFTFILDALELIFKLLSNKKLLALMCLVMMIITLKCQKSEDIKLEDKIFPWPDSLPGRIIISNEGNISSYN